MEYMGSQYHPLDGQADGANGWYTGPDGKRFYLEGDNMITEARWDQVNQGSSAETRGGYEGPWTDLIPEEAKGNTLGYGQSQARENAKVSYVDWVKWKRKELNNLLSRYRTEFPKQIKAYKQSAYGAMPEAEKDMWGGMYSNLNQRGLSDSTSFVGGARKDLEAWKTSEKSRIEDTAQGMKTGAQQAILAALGRPDYAGLYKGWVNQDQSTMEYIDHLKNWKK